MLPNIPKWKLQYIVIFESKTKNLWIINIHIWELPPIVCIYYIYIDDDDDDDDDDDGDDGDDDDDDGQTLETMGT